MKHGYWKSVSAALVLVALSAVLAGCGGQGDEVLSLAQETSGEAGNTEATEEQGTEGTAESTGEAEAQSDTEGGCLAVYICGAVVTPGVYEVTADMRLVDAVELAGGFSKDADTTYWNLAGKLADGEMYYIPTVSETAEENFSVKTEESVSGNSTDVTAAGASSDGLISINTASQEELTELPGIGTTKASAIITYRETNGPFTSIDEIMNVTGIGESTYEKLKDYICL